MKSRNRLAVRTTTCGATSSESWRSADCSSIFSQRGSLSRTTKRIFPLLDSDKSLLLRLYPQDWKPAP